MDKNKIAYEYADKNEINYYHAMADVEERIRLFGEEEAERWFTRYLSGESISWNTQA